MSERSAPHPPSVLSRVATHIYSAAALQSTGRLRQAVQSILIVSPPQSPTFDYYLAPCFGAQISIPVARADLREPADRCLNDATADGAFVIFCRYVSSDWLRAVERTSPKLAGVGLLVDDDIPGLVADTSVPLLYRTRLVLNHFRYRTRLASSLDFVFVSTDALAARESSAHPIVVGPAPSAEDTPVPRTSLAGKSGLRVAFHSTASHAAEHAWLAPVLRAVSRRVPDVTFDVHVNRITRRYWRGFENIELRPVERWNDYRAATRARGADLLLAPQLASSVNDVRAPTKRIDAFRMGAALITNAGGVYAPSSKEANLGMLLPLAPEAWIDGLASLLTDRPRIARLAQLNADRVSGWAPSPIAELISR